MQATHRTAALDSEPKSGLMAAIARLPAVFWIVLLWCVLFINAATGYIRFDTNENRIGSYALDVLQNGHWIAQTDATGTFITKPPGMTWLVVLFSKCLGGLSTTALYLPTGLAVLGVALLLFWAGREYFSARTGVIAAVMFLVSYVGDRQLLTARYDGLFAFPVAVGAIAAYRGWATGRGWFVFWIAMTAGGMVKGPLVFVLALIGLAAAIWERNPGFLFKWSWQHAIGITVFALVCGGWLALVLANYRQQFMDVIIGKELVGHALSDRGSGQPAQQIWRAPASIFVQFLPWSIPGVVAIINLFRGKQGGGKLSFDRYLVCSFLGGLLLFAVAAHQRDRLIWPLLPAFALLAARQFDAWLRSRPDRIVYRSVAAVAICFVLFSVVYHQVLLGRSSHSREYLALRSVAQTLRTRLGERPPVAYVDVPFAVQFNLGYLRPATTVVAAQALLTNNSPAFVLASGEASGKITGQTNGPVFCLDRWRVGKKEELQLLANRPSYKTAD